MEEEQEEYEYCQPTKRRKFVNGGLCNACNQHLSSSDVAKKHIIGKCSDVARLLRPEDENPAEEGIVILVRAKTRPNDAKKWWLFVAVPMRFTLGQLDNFFRTIWCDPDGYHHADSRFEMNKKGEYGFDLVRFSLKTTIGDALTKSEDGKLLFGCERMSLIVQHVANLNCPVRRHHAIVLARNSIPDEPCQNCFGGSAKFFCFDCGEEFCDSCLHQGRHYHEGDESDEEEDEQDEEVTEIDGDEQVEEGVAENDESDEDSFPGYPDDFKGNDYIKVMRNSPGFWLWRKVSKKVIQSESKVDFKVPAIAIHRSSEEDYQKCVQNQLAISKLVRRSFREDGLREQNYRFL